MEAKFVLEISKCLTFQCIYILKAQRPYSLPQRLRVFRVLPSYTIVTVGFSCRSCKYYYIINHAIVLAICIKYHVIAYDRSQSQGGYFSTSTPMNKPSFGRCVCSPTLLRDKGDVRSTWGVIFGEMGIVCCCFVALQSGKLYKCVCSLPQTVNIIWKMVEFGSFERFVCVVLQTASRSTNDLALNACMFCV